MRTANREGGAGARGEIERAVVCPSCFWPMGEEHRPGYRCPETVPNSEKADAKSEWEAGRAAAEAKQRGKEIEERMKNPYFKLGYEMFRPPTGGVGL